MNREYICHGCWERYSFEKLQYRTSGGSEHPERAAWAQGPGGSAQRPVRDLNGSVVKRWLSSLFSEGPSATRLFSTKGRSILYCPSSSCGEPLNDRNLLPNDNPAFLGILGPRRAGKTLFTTVMARELIRTKINGKTLGLVGLGETDRHVQALTMQLDRGERPPPTHEEATGSGSENLPESKERRLAWQLQFFDPQRRRIAPVFLASYDVAGEPLNKGYQQDFPVLDNFMRSLTSLVFLIDGKAVAKDLGLRVKDAWDPSEQASPAGLIDSQVLANVRNRIGERSRSEVDLALVLSKADYLWDQPRWQKLKPGLEGVSQEEVQEILLTLFHDSDRNPLWTEAHTNFRQVSLFTTSSVGFRPRQRDVGEDGCLQRPIKPLGITAPIVWLLGQRLQIFRSSKP